MFYKIFIKGNIKKSVKICVIRIIRVLLQNSYFIKALYLIRSKLLSVKL